jgi:hypothetical protein
MERGGGQRAVVIWLFVFCQHTGDSIYPQETFMNDLSTQEKVLILKEESIRRLKPLCA